MDRRHTPAQHFFDTHHRTLISAVIAVPEAFFIDGVLLEKSGHIPHRARAADDRQHQPLAL